MTKGRRKTTGRYETREELVHWVWRWWLVSGMSQADIARASKVSETTVANILKTKEGMPNENDGTASE